MNVDIVGEDPVTQAIIERLISDYRKDIVIKERLPARGGQIKANAPKYNLLESPIIMLTDLDLYPCPPSLIADWFGATSINQNMLFRIAQEEAETWLMADREGFAKWLGVPIDILPIRKKIDKKKPIYELICPIKPSLYMMLNIASNSPKAELKDLLTPKAGAKKGPGYNSALLPFIKNKWDVKNAASNSSSLSKAIARLKKFKKTKSNKKLAKS
jgi:hypothetical protein